MSEVLEKVYRINEINRQRVDVAAAEFSRMLVDLANGISVRRKKLAHRERVDCEGNAELNPVPH